MLSISFAILSKIRELLKCYVPAYSDDYEKMRHDLNFHSNHTTVTNETMESKNLPEA